MLYAAAVIGILLMIVSLMLLFLGLPGNWVIIGIAALWTLVTGASLGLQFFVLVCGLALLGEVAEFLAGHYGAKRYGGSNQGSIGGMIGAITGGIVCAPIFFGFGALLGALGGGYLGCFAVEKVRGASARAAASAAFGATLGRFGGFVVKMGIGIGIIWLTASRMFAAI